MKGYLKAAEAKLLQHVSETFCLVPTNDTNCCYLDRLIAEALAEQCKSCKKGRSGGSRSAASPMIKLAKKWR